MNSAKENDGVVAEDSRSLQRDGGAHHGPPHGLRLQGEGRPQRLRVRPRGR